MHVRASSSAATEPHPCALPSQIGGQQYVASQENDGGKQLGKGHGRVENDELLPGASLNTHEEAMQLLCLLGNKLGAIRDICFCVCPRAIPNPKFLVLPSYPGGVLLEQHLAYYYYSPHHQSLSLT